MREREQNCLHLGGSVCVREGKRERVCLRASGGAGEGKCVRLIEGGREGDRGAGGGPLSSLLQPRGLLESPAVWSEGPAGEVRFHYLSLCVIFSRSECKTGTINNPVTAATSWRFTVRANASLLRAGGFALRSQDERPTLPHLVPPQPAPRPSRVPHPQSLPPDPQSPGEREAHKCLDTPLSWAAWG